MKKIILLLIAAIGTLPAVAQNINPEVDNVPPADAPVVHKNCDSLFTGWAVDINLNGGLLTQTYTTVNQVANYSNAITQGSKISDIKFNNGMSYGIDAEISRFFGRSKHFGIGTGVFYLYQQGNVTMDSFHVQYQSTDNFKNTFRQVITADQPIKETLGISNFNIPLLLKYKTRFSRRWGFTADAGALINLQEKYAYNTNASFDYEAIYKYVPTDNGASYDNSLTPASSDLLIEKSPYLTNHTEAQLQNYFSTLKGEGYNVGLGVKPNNNTGSVSYKIGSVGLLVRPAISYYLCENVALNVGVYYLYQTFNNSASSYQLTSKIGSYNSVVNSVTTSVNNSYGVSVGVRIFFNKKKTEEPPAEAPPVDNETEVLPIPAPPPPPAPPTEENAEEPEEISVSTPILFNLNKTTIHPSSYPVLEEAVKEIGENKGAYIEINGYTDITGTSIYNMGLSKKRAAVVKNYLKKKGVNPKQMKTVGHGAKSPAASNKTAEGRAENRRVIMKIKQKE